MRPRGRRLWLPRLALVDCQATLDLDSVSHIQVKTSRTVRRRLPARHEPLKAVYDILIRGGVVIDGSGAPGQRGDVAVADRRIAAIAPHIDQSLAVVAFDAAGLTVAPGIVDQHTHSDASLLSEPHCVSEIVQGVTTMAVGLCGFSAGPFTRESRATAASDEPVFGYPDVEMDWLTVGGYLDAVDAVRPALNVLTMVGHNTIRRTVMGGEGRPPTQTELQAMCGLLRDALREGARGLSTGLSYAPGLFAEGNELTALAGVAAAEGRPYHTHMRYGNLTVRASLEEAISTARVSGVDVNVSHLYPRRWDPPGEADRLLDLVGTARAQGVAVTFDVTVFEMGGGSFLQTLPGWARRGGLAATVALIHDPAARKRLIQHLNGEHSGATSAGLPLAQALIVKINKPENAALAGRTIGEVAASRGVGPEETALDLVVEDGQYWTAWPIKRQADLDRLMRDPLCVPVTDGMASHPVKHRPYGLMPKTFGSFPLVLGSYVRERCVLGLEEAIHRMTDVPARRLGLHDRGRLAPGCAADLFVFDPRKIGNRATDAEPHHVPVGIARVMVNGEWVVVDGSVTGARPGRAIR